MFQFCRLIPMKNGINSLLWTKPVVAQKQCGNDTRWMLVSVLDMKKIGWGKFGTVYKSHVKVGNRIRKFAIKEFFPQHRWSVDHSLLMHEQLRKLGIPTWITYRKISMRSILMTLGNDNWSLIFSSHNKSSDVKKIKKILYQIYRKQI